MTFDTALGLLDFKFNPATFEHDFNVWETIKTKYERQSCVPSPDGVIVATLLNKTAGVLQHHLRLNARELANLSQVRGVILEYHRSRLLMNPLVQTSANAAFQGGSHASPYGQWCLSGSLADRKRKRRKKRKRKEGKRNRKGLFEVAGTLKTKVQK